MKTPKRDYKTPSNQLAQDIEADFFESDLYAQEARWRRKNRAAQLKHTIARLNRELAIFIEPENFALICDALVTHAASSSDLNTELRCLRLLTSLAQA